MASRDPIEDFAKRMDKRAATLLVKVDKMVVEAFNAIAHDVAFFNPVWSSQSVVNWTASIGHSPLRRHVNVDRSNVGFRNGRVTGSRAEGNKDSITRHREIASTARLHVWMAAKDVSARYKRATGKAKPKSIWLSNSISYTPKLWTGGWRSNPRTLASTIDAGVRAASRIKVFRF